MFGQVSKASQIDYLVQNDQLPKKMNVNEDGLKAS